MCEVQGREVEAKGDGRDKAVGRILVDSGRRRRTRRESFVMGLRTLKVEKLRNSVLFSTTVASSRSQMKVWLIRATTTVMLWTCIVQLTALGETWGPRMLMGLPSCLSRESTIDALDEKGFDASVQILPAKRVYRNNGYLMVSCNGGLNQMRAAICDMVAIARFLNVTLIVPELDKTSFWADPSDFHGIFDVDHFITSLRDEVRILKELPPRLKKREELGLSHAMAPVSWSDISYYHNQMEELGRRVIQLLRRNDPFLVLHLCYEMDMLAFSGCMQGCSDDEVEELTSMRYSYPWWKEKVIISELKRKEGLCPLMPEETALTLRELGIDHNIQIYIAAGEMYGGERRMSSLAAAYPRWSRLGSLSAECEEEHDKDAEVDRFLETRGLNRMDMENTLPPSFLRCLPPMRLLSGICQQITEDNIMCVWKLHDDQRLMQDRWKHRFGIVPHLLWVRCSLPHFWGCLRLAVIHWEIIKYPYNKIAAASATP